MQALRAELGEQPSQSHTVPHAGHLRASPPLSHPIYDKGLDLPGRFHNLMAELCEAVAVEPHALFSCSALIIGSRGSTHRWLAFDVVTLHIGQPKLETGI